MDALVMSSDLKRSFFDELETGVKNLTISRYAAIAGYMVLLWDSVLLLREERRLIWSTHSSPVKWIYLGNKYTVITILTIVNFTELTGVVKSSMFCKVWGAIHISLGILSIAVCNGLVLIRVCILWENRRLVFNILFTILIFVTAAALGFTAYALNKITPSLTYNSLFQACIATEHTQLLAPAWGIPLIFDATVFIMTCWNALDRPRQLTTRITTSLSKDGFFYFLIIGTLRVFNVIVIWKAPVSLAYCGAYLTWALVTVSMSRLLINLRVAETGGSSVPSSSPSRMTPFNATSSNRGAGSLSDIKIQLEQEYEMM